MERRKLFSQVPPTPRRKLFCGTEEQEHEVMCHDCGYKTMTSISTTSMVCPKCGGKRFDCITAEKIETPAENLQTEESTAEKEFSERRSLFEDEFQRNFSETNDEFELKLKEFSGKTLNQEEYTNIFGDTDLCERGFACTLEDGSIKVNDTAFIQTRLFSKMIISITKTLDLDPEIVSRHRTPEEVISGLDMQPKCIMLLKKSHRIPIEKDSEDWAKDSGILGDLRIEFGGQKKPMPEFKRDIEEMYPDAPENIIDILKKHGIINTFPGDDEVEINK